LLHRTEELIFVTQNMKLFMKHKLISFLSEMRLLYFSFSFYFYFSFSRQKLILKSRELFAF
jgi:hypothetical protein